ncbi:MAG: type II secretion system secretin GspD [Sphingomonadaceae bacterium]
MMVTNIPIRLLAVVLLCLAPSVIAQDKPEDNASVTVVPGSIPPPMMPATVAPKVRSGDVTLNFPSADIRAVAKSVLSDVLGLPYTVAPGLSTAVTVVTPRPIARSSVLAFFEDALRNSGLALIRQNGGYIIDQIDRVRGTGTIGESAIGFGDEVFQLAFVNADQMKRMLDPLLPGVVTSADPSRNVLTLSGTSGQRTSARDLLQQFDVNWLRAMSFALIVPKRTDSRLIVPELEKLINAPDAPTRGLVRLITMEKINGILAVSSQPQYLDDVNRWIDVLDREGQNNEPKLFVYKVQNGRSRDLARTINTAFGNSTSNGTSDGQPAIEFSGNPDGNNNASNNGRRSNDRTASPDGLSTNRQVPSGAPPQSDTSTATSNGGRIQATISSDDNNNAIIVFGTPREFAVIEDALRKLDVLPYQVLIEAAITEVSLTDDLRYGLQWNFTSGNTNTVLTDSSSATNLVRAVPGFSFLFARNNTLSAVLNTLETKTKVNVVSAPKLLVLNNQTATLQVGDQVPVATQNSTATTDPNAPTINSIEYRDTGVILKVTPRVNGSGLVLLDIAQEVSDVNSSVARGTGINSPTISTRRISTSVAVQDGEVLALGGLIRNTQTKGRNGIPFLSQIPIVGAIFGRQTKNEDRIELIVLLKPRVVRSVDDGRAITDELRAKIRSLEPFKSSGQIP